MAEGQTSKATDSSIRERHANLEDLQEIIRKQGEQIKKLAQDLFIKQARGVENAPPPPTSSTSSITLYGTLV